MNIILPEVGDRPIAVYDTEKKKLILLFQNSRLCTQYTFNLDHYGISNLIRGKYVNKTNIFGKKLTFRYCTEEQRKVLLDSDYLIVDMDYDRPDFKYKPSLGNVKKVITDQQNKAAYQRKKIA